MSISKERNIRLVRERSKCATAFTIIELLVVVVVTTILAVLVLAAIVTAKQKMRQAKCGHNVGQIALGVQIFVTDNHSYPLYVNSKYRLGAYPEQQTAWITAVESQFTAGDPVHTSHSAIYRDKTIWQCPAGLRPAIVPSHETYYSYGYNGFGLNTQTNTTGKKLGLGGHYGWNDNPDKWMGPPVTETEVVNPSQLMLLGDGFRGGKGFIVDGSPCIGRNDNTKDHLGSTARAVNRHQRTANIAFSDGHVNPLKLTDLFENDSDAALSLWNRDNLPHRELLAP